MAKHEQLTVTELVSPQGKTIAFAAAAPTTGAHKVGEIVFNTVPTAGGTFAWSCTTAGTPGTWKAVALAG